MIALNALKDGKRFAVTVSYDDGMVFDRKLISIFNEYGIRGTFHLNSGHYPHADGVNAISAEQLPEVYKGHEVACHGVTHTSMFYLNQSGVMHEILEDRKALERYMGYPVRGLSYANGSYTKETLNALRACGIVYSRTTKNTNGFAFPEEWLEWHPTCHQSVCLDAAERFIKQMDGYWSGPKLLYVWGHSHEFERTMEWETIKRFSEMISGNDRIWYATNIEIYNYITAQRQLVLSADHTLVYNPTATEIWFTSDGETCSVKPGETWHKK